MKGVKKAICLVMLLCISLHQQAWAKLPVIDAHKTTLKIQEILKYHASYKELNAELIRRMLQTYLEELDPTKTYFIRSDIQPWLDPSDDLVQKILKDYQKDDYSTFFQIHEAMIQAIQKRKQLELQMDQEKLPAHVNPSEFKDLKWAENQEELLNRLIRLRALQVSTASKLNEELRDQSLQRIEKRQQREEEEISNPEPTHRQQFVLNNVLKAMASSLDAHTAYFTPDEAAQFMINVQQRLFGIGAQLRDDLNGFTVTKIIEGGPAANGKELKLKDRIIAVNGEPVVGMDITDAVDLIRGEESTPVTLTVIRQVPDGDKTREEKVNIIVNRGEVVLKETRYNSSVEPFGDGVIAYLKLYSFYQDPDSSSADDLSKEFEKIKAKYKVKGVILDLRSNSGGMLSQAVSVTGLFITKGIVVSIKDETGRVQHLRDVDGTSMWDGPLVVLINRASASAAEIVAQTLQDYGRALVVGDDHSYGKGSFQTFTLNTNSSNQVNSEGEYKVTRGRYYTVSGRTPQLNGVISNVVVPGGLSESEIGEKFSKHPLENDQIPENFDDDLSDIPYFQRQRAKLLYKFNLQPRNQFDAKLVDQLKSNSVLRVQNNKTYQAFLEELKKKDKEIIDDEESAPSLGQNDFQLNEAYNVMRDLIILQQK